MKTSTQKQSSNGAVRIAQGLVRQLKSFGLNPNDWHIERAASDIPDWYDMTHIDDLNFRFHARISPTPSGEFRIRNLFLASL